MRRPKMWLALAALVLVASGRADDAFRDDPVERAAVEAIEDVYRSFDAEALRRLPIGVFDSGTGGLTVLEQILSIDAFDNRSHRPVSEGDGKLDFVNESFIFLADQANMPYGNYPDQGKTEFLEDLIVKDAWFLMGRDRFPFPAPDNEFARHGKSPVKAIVIACNTATAYGQDDIERVIAGAHIDIHVVGVIEAGAKGALEVFVDGEPGAIGVVPTRGTVLSGAYPAAIRSNAKKRGLKQRIDIFQQGAFGLAGAIDGASDFIDLDAESSTTRDDYRGPSMARAEARIDRNILPRYAFDFSGNHILYSGPADDPQELQLNSVDNYIAYHLVTLMEQIRAAGDAPPLRAVILGCTHFPFYRDSFRRQLNRLREYQEDGRYVYRQWMAANIELIDPAYYTARELYQRLATQKRIRMRPATTGHPRGTFYLTIPRRDDPRVELSETGWFTYDFKYGREAGKVASHFVVVPLDEKNVDRDVLNRLEKRVPAVWRLLASFR